jgi:hypothetical protein
MIIVNAQPNELYFAWQNRVQLENFKEFSIDMSSVYILVGVKPGEHALSDWVQLGVEYGVNIQLFFDLRESSNYLSSIRPHLMHQFLQKRPELEKEFMFYTDCDVLLLNDIPFEGMMDGRVHWSETNYNDLTYVESKHSSTLTRDMLAAVGIDYQTAKEYDKLSGGVHYLFPGTTASFWKTIEYQTEIMHSVVKANEETYRQELYAYYVSTLSATTAAPDYAEWKIYKKEEGGWDFQIWCADLFCIFWELAKRGTRVYRNPFFNFAWPGFERQYAEDNMYLFHNSGIMPDAAELWFHKQDYKKSFPFTDKSIDKKGFLHIKDEQGNLLEIKEGAQRIYIDLIKKIGTERYNMEWEQDTIQESYNGQLPLVSCVMTTYGRFEVVERSIACWLLQSYENKELIIFNTAPVPLVLGEDLLHRDIFVFNQQIDTQTSQYYDNVGAVRRDAANLAHGQYYICWDDDDLFLPWHIEQGVEYLLKHPEKKAYMPMYSYFTQDGGKTFSLERNSMEASCIVDINEIRKAGFANSNGAEHLTWRQGLRDTGELDEYNDVSPMESYMYIWGENIAPRKQSGHINDPNNFENHKLANTDFGDRPLGFYVHENLSDWFLDILRYRLELLNRSDRKRLFRALASFI